jgi:arsenite methyltransferase
MTLSTQPEEATRERYSAAAAKSEAALCCPVSYNPEYLKIIPSEVIEKDYGCGDPSRHVRPGETVLDLGSGTGKICFIAAQVVGAQGRVIGVDMTDDMLEVARRNAPVVAQRLGYDNVEFRKGRIQDLALDMEAVDKVLASAPVSSANDYLAAEGRIAQLREMQPLIATESIDIVVSNCVLNLVQPALKKNLFREIFRVLRHGGRAVISDIVSDEEVPLHMQRDAHLWSGCISGAYTESGFIQAFEEAGFCGIQILERDSTPWQTVEGIEFRSVTIQAHKTNQGPCLERNQAVIYKGPFKKVLDDDGHAMERGKRYAVCDKTFQLYQGAPYREHFYPVPPLHEVAHEEAQLFACTSQRERHPHETKGLKYNATIPAQKCLGGSDCC